MGDLKLILVLAILPLAAIGGGAGLLLVAILGVEAIEPRRDDGRPGDYQPPHPPRRSPGGPPLLDAVSARVRLRQPGRLADLISPPARRTPVERRRRAPPAHRL
jgi:hypothetical protein